MRTHAHRTVAGAVGYGLYRALVVFALVCWLVAATMIGHRITPRIPAVTYHQYRCLDHCAFTVRWQR